MCEDHPDQPLAHDDCRGQGGLQCLEPDCPWWQGPAPKAFEIEWERRFLRVRPPEGKKVDG